MRLARMPRAWPETLARVSIVATPGKQRSLPGRSPALRLTGEASMTTTAASTKQEPAAATVRSYQNVRTGPDGHSLPM